MNFLKQVCKNILRRYGKRITNLHAPAKSYEDGMLFLTSIIETPKWVIDIGVADGTPDLWSAFPLKEHNYLLIEANPGFYPYLESLKENHADTVHVERCFCGEQEGSTLFHINKGGHTASRYSTQGNQESIKVPVATLDTLVNKNRVEGPILLKLDVEGAELDVLQGASRTLELCDVVILEAWVNMPVEKAADFTALIEFMSQQSFVVYDFLGGHTYKNGVLKHIDVVFVKRDSPYRSIVT